MRKWHMRRLAQVIAFAALTAMGVAPANATVTVLFDNGTTQVTTALTGFATTGAMMDGMSVTAFFAGGTQETAFWAATVGDDGEAAGTGWSLSESGDTFSSFDPWALANASGLAIEMLLIDAGVGDSVFDITFGGLFGTDGSALGITFASSDTRDVTATYIDEVALTGFAVVGDLWRFLKLDFGAGIASGSPSFNFSADTDNLELPGDITPVPEPSTLALFGIGLAGLAFVRRRRKKSI